MSERQYGKAAVLFRISEIENNFSNVNKSTLVSACKVFMEVDDVLQRNEPDIFEIVLKWCRLYLDIQAAIDPKDSKLLEQYENTASTAITYIIGYLQYKTKEPEDYHYSLLEILESLLNNLPGNILKRCNQYETGTISCLWKPIHLARDFKTQLFALKIFSTLLKYLDEDKRNDELEVIYKLNDMNLFKKELSTLIQETARYSVWENASRELLNNYNTNVHNNAKNLSFYCSYLTIGNKIDFFKPLNSEKFWIDLNYVPQTIAFKGRFRMDSSSRYQVKDITLRVQNVKLENSTLYIHFDKSNVMMFSTLSNENVVEIFLSLKEEQRLKRNQNLMKYLNKFDVGKASTDSHDPAIDVNNNEDVFDRLKNERSSVRPQDSGEDIGTNVSKIFRKLFTPVDDSDYSPTDVTARPINTSTPTVGQSPAKSSKTTDSDVIKETPVSNKIRQFRNIINHPIRSLRPKRRYLSYAEIDDKDYVPNKKFKKVKSKRKRGKLQNKHGLNVKNAVDSVSADSTGGNECAIGHTNKNDEQNRDITEGISVMENKEKSAQNSDRCGTDANFPALQLKVSNKNGGTSPSGITGIKSIDVPKETTENYVSDIRKGQRSFAEKSVDLHSRQRDKTCLNSHFRVPHTGNAKANEENPLETTVKYLNIGTTVQKTNNTQNDCKKCTGPSLQNQSINCDDIQLKSSDCREIPTSKPILRISRSIKQRVTIDLAMTDIENACNLSKNSNDTYSEDFPQLRLAESRKDDIITISTPQSVPQTPTSPDTMNISDICNDASSMVNFQHRKRSGDLSRTSLNLNAIQQIMDDWQVGENSVNINFEDIDNNEGHVGGEESFNRKESTQLKKIGDNTNDGYINNFCGNESHEPILAKQSVGHSSEVNKNFRSLSFKREKKEQNAKLMLYKSEKNDETFLNVGNGFSSLSNVSTNMEESIIVLSDDSLDDYMEEEKSTYKALENSTKLYEKDFSQFNSKIVNCLKDLRHHCIENATDINKQKVCEITENIVNESKEQRKDLQQLISNIERWRGQMEEQCQLYIKRSIKIESFQANAEKLLNALAGNSNIGTGISNECEDLIEHFSEIKGDDRLQFCTNYMGTRTKGNGF